MTWPPEEIVRRYREGEREIRVNTQVYADYGDGIMVAYRRVPYDTANDRGEPYLAYKEARVYRQPTPMGGVQ